MAPDCGAADCLAVAKRVRLGVCGAPVRPGHGEPAGTCSLGRSIARAEPVDDLIARADAALYRAKANGRNRTELAGEMEMKCGRRTD